MFDPDSLLPALQSADASSFCIGFSGGLDSTVLLHACHALFLQGRVPALRALHVHHGLSPSADNWSVHCVETCGRLGVPIEVLRVDVDQQGMGVEAAARNARYTGFGRALEAGECLLLAHHRDDQAETFLLRALRGAGVRGLGGMPETRALGEAKLLRPLLSWSRDELEVWAVAQCLRWVDDESNADFSIDRNYLRNSVFPDLRTRWPAVQHSFAQAAAHCRAAEQLVRDFADQTRSQCATPAGGLRSDALADLPPNLRREVLRSQCWRQNLPLPDARALQSILAHVIAARKDANPLVHWEGGEARRFRNTVYLSAPLPAAPEGRQWIEGGPLDLGAGCGVVRLSPETDQGIDTRQLAGRRLSIGFRQGGERFRPYGRQGRHPLKKLFQELCIAPWLRDRVPLLFADGEMVAAAGVVCEASWYTSEPAYAMQLCWEPSPAIGAPLEYMVFHAGQASGDIDKGAE